MRDLPRQHQTTLAQWLAVAAIWGLAAYGVLAKPPAQSARPAPAAACR